MYLENINSASQEFEGRGSTLNKSKAHPLPPTAEKVVGSASFNGTQSLLCFNWSVRNVIEVEQSERSIKNNWIGKANLQSLLEAVDKEIIENSNRIFSLDKKDLLAISIRLTSILMEYNKPCNSADGYLNNLKIFSLFNSSKILRFVNKHNNIQNCLIDLMLKQLETSRDDNTFSKIIRFIKMSGKLFNADKQCKFLNRLVGGLDSITQGMATSDQLKISVQCFCAYMSIRRVREAGFKIQLGRLKKYHQDIPVDDVLAILSTPRFKPSKVFVRFLKELDKSLTNRELDLNKKLSLFSEFAHQGYLPLSLEGSMKALLEGADLRPEDGILLFFNYAILGETCYQAAFEDFLCKIKGMPADFRLSQEQCFRLLYAASVYLKSKHKHKDYLQKIVDRLLKSNLSDKAINSTINSAFILKLECSRLPDLPTFSRKVFKEGGSADTLNKMLMNYSIYPSLSLSSDRNSSECCLSQIFDNRKPLIIRILGKYHFRLGKSKSLLGSSIRRAKVLKAFGNKVCGYSRGNFLSPAFDTWLRKLLENSPVELPEKAISNEKSRILDPDFGFNLQERLAEYSSESGNSGSSGKKSVVETSSESQSEDNPGSVEQNADVEKYKQKASCVEIFCKYVLPWTAAIVAGAWFGVGTKLLSGYQESGRRSEY